jgi:hypothetical protein
MHRHLRRVAREFQRRWEETGGATGGGAKSGELTGGGAGGKVARPRPFGTATSGASGTRPSRPLGTPPSGPSGTSPSGPSATSPRGPSGTNLSRRLESSPSRTKRRHENIDRPASQSGSNTAAERASARTLHKPGGDS